jgi:replicative DNA helicase
MIERLLPHDQEAERLVLGSVIIDNKNLFMVSAMVSPEDFYAQSHREIFSAMRRLQVEDKPIDYLTLRNELQRAGKLDTAGGIAYVSSLTEGVAAATNTEHYTVIIREKAKLRQMIQVCGNTTEQCYADEDPADEIIDAHETQIRKIGNQTASGPVSIGDAVYETYEEIKKRYDDKRRVTGIASGIQALDDITTGLQPGDLDVLAGKTGGGKTALALNLITHAALREQRRILIFSLEMNRRQLGMRMISSESGVPEYQMRTGYVASGDWSKIGKAAGVIGDARIWIHDKSITIGELDAVARRIADQHGLDLILVDYLQLVIPSGQKFDNRTHEVTVISRRLKALATDLDVPVLALSQLNENGDVRESRAIEQDASLLMVVEMSRDDLKQMREVPAKLQINKNRHGKLETVNMVFHKDIVRFREGSNQ